MPLVPAFILSLPLGSLPARAAGELSPIRLNEQSAVSLSRMLAQNPGVVPTDATPFQVGTERQAFMPRLKFRLFQKLPAPLWFTIITEETQRWETNVFQSPTHGRHDYVFRTLPNITVGYALGEHTNIYSNFFMIKDVYAANRELGLPITTSVSMGVRRDFPVGRKTAIQLDMQARELWQAPQLRQADLLPALSVTRTLTPRSVLFGSLLLQMRSRNLFQGPTRELDPFYSVGVVVKRGDWIFVATDTFVTNFRFNGAIPSEGNVTMVIDFEAAHPISKKFPELMAFVRAEPIYNWRSHFVDGQSGYDFRLFGGLRLAINKPAYNVQINRLRRELLEARERINKKQTGMETAPKDMRRNSPSEEEKAGTQTPIDEPGKHIIEFP